MSSSVIEKLINEDKIEAASSKVNEVLKVSENAEKVAINILRVLAIHLSKIIKSQTVFKSPCQPIYTLANKCCILLKKTWNCNHVSFMQILYNINDYLIKNGAPLFAKKLTLYFVSLKTHRGTPWTKDQKTVLICCLNNFGNYLHQTDDKCRIIISQEEDSFQSWWNFILTLSKLNDLENISSTFHVSAIIFSKILNTTDSIAFGNVVFKGYSSLIEGMSMNSPKIINTQKDVSLLASFIDSYVFQITELTSLDCKDLLNFLNNISSLTKNKSYSSQIEIIKNLILLSSEDDSQQFSSLIVKVSANIKNLHTTISIELTSFVANLIFKLCRNIVKTKHIIDENGSNLLKLVIDLQPIFLKILSQVVVNQKKYNSIINKVACSALAIVLSFGQVQEKLKAIFKDMWSTLCFFFNCSDFPGASLNELTFGVDHFRRILILYKKAQLNHETKELCRGLILYLKRVKFIDPPPSCLKENVAQILNYFVETSPGALFSYECLTYLLALAYDQNPLFDFEDKFKYWCKLKLVPGNKSESLTVYDIINRDIDRQLDETVVDEVLKWPFSTVMDLDYEELLLAEIKSYLKYKELMKTPVISIYKISVGVVKSKVTLARILCCATEAVTRDCNVIPSISNFHLSLKNMAKMFSLKNREINEVSEIEKKLLLGDIHYYIARCEICNQRKITQKLLVDSQPSVTVDFTLPIVEDPLNMSIVSNEYTFITYSTQNKIISFLNQAFDCWTHAAGLLKRQKNSMNGLSLAVDLSLRNLKSMGYLHRLYKNVKHEVAVWQLLFETADLFNKPKYKIIAFSELLCTTLNIDKNLIEEMVTYVKAQTNIQNEYYYHLFMVSLGKNNLFNKKYDESKKIHEDLQPSTLDGYKSFRLVNIQYGMFSYWLKSALFSYDRSISRLLINLFEQCISIQKNELCLSFTEETINNALLLDLSLMVSRSFCQGKDARLARLYSVNPLKLAQELHLPIRTCELLILEAQVDQCCIDATQVAKKLSGIETILELRLRAPSYELHLDDCSCVPCSHIEYQITLIYAVSVKGGFYRLQQESNSCIKMYKDGQTLISRLNKHSSGNYLTETVDCDIYFSMTAIDLLSEWGKYEKVSKYLERTMKIIEKRHKPCNADLSSLSFTNIFKFKFNLPKPTPSNVTSLYLEPDLDESSKTPQMSNRILRSPPAIGWKVCSGKKSSPKIECQNVKTKKLNFNYVSSEIINISDSNSSPKSIQGNSDVENNNSDTAKEVGKENCATPTTISKNIPMIVIDSDESSSPINVYKRSNINMSCGNYLEVPGNRRNRNTGRRKNHISSLKSPINVYCDNDNNKSPGWGKSTKENTTVTKSPKSTHDSKTNLEKCKGVLVRKKLFDKDKILDNQSDSSDNSNVQSQGQIVIISTLDDSSIIDATIVEDDSVSKFQLPSSTRKEEAWETKFSNLCLTPKNPSSGLIPLVATNSVKETKKSRRKIDCSKTYPNQQDQSSQITSVETKKLPITAQDVSTPSIRMTRSIKKHLFSSTKNNRI